MPVVLGRVVKKVRPAAQLWRHFGPRWLVQRGVYTARLRVGLVRRRMPAIEWHARSLQAYLSDPRLADPTAYLSYRRNEAPPFFFAPSSRPQYEPLFARWDASVGGDAIATPIVLSEELAGGTLRYFEHNEAQVGAPPDWHRNPFSEQRADSGRHWSRIGDFDLGDIKIIWEPSRFGAAYALVRAYWRTGDNRYAELFWQLVEDWRLNNPPQTGPNWKCGQEISFRIMAWCFGLYGLLDAPATTPQRVSSLAEMIAHFAQRIRANIPYAISQLNNHGISEAMGLWTVGALFPEFELAAEWRETGRKTLESEGRKLIYPDGAFSQHSVNYHRLMLHDYLWALRLGDLQGAPFSTGLRARVAQAGAFLYSIQDGVSGRVPYYGQNDGALILPLSNSDYRDFRPVTQAIHYLATGKRAFSEGPWDEALLWLFGPDALHAPLDAPERGDLRAKEGGYYTLRSPGGPEGSEGFVFTRAATFRHRPGQADMLHADIWWRGQNVALDAGAYSYSAPPPWNNPLAHTAYHNTVTVDGMDQMERVGKFLWLPWLKGRELAYRRAAKGRLAYWEGMHDGYRRLAQPVLHRRGILSLGFDQWLVLDSLTSRGDHLYRLHWLLPDLPYTWDESGHVLLQTPFGPYSVQLAPVSAYAAPDVPASGQGQSSYSLVRADPSSPRGWQAPYYSYREPALSLALAQRGSSICLWSLLGPAGEEPARVVAAGRTIEIQGRGWGANVRLNSGGAERAERVSGKGSLASPLVNPLVSSVELLGEGGELLETLEIAK